MAVVLARFVAFAAGVALFGAPLFVLYSRLGSEGAPRRLRPLLIGAALLAGLSAAAALVAQTGQMAGEPRAGFDPATLRDVITGSGFGVSILARAGAALAALVALLMMRPGPRLWTATTMLGGVLLAALAWGGHGAADAGVAGVAHAAADVIHLLAAGAWLGALLSLGLMLYARGPPDPAPAVLHGALKGFSGMGSVIVALIVASGLVNGWFLVGPQRLAGIVTTPWGWLLSAKLVLFAAMLALAALNRFRLTPRLAVTLAHDPKAALKALRRSLALESAAGLGVLGLVAALGVLPPPASL